MSPQSISRRAALKKSGILAVASGLSASLSAAQTPKSKSSRPFLYCLNTATIRGQKVGIVKELEITAKAGYDSVEPWIDTILDYTKSGGTLSDLRKRIQDLGLTVESAIGFPEWIVDDEARRAKGMEQAKRDLDIVAQLGGKRLAAPPAGATGQPKLDLLKAAERYRALLEAGDAVGVVPQLELWGFSGNLNRLGECACVAIEAAHPKACVLADVYHLYKGGSDYRALRMMGPDTVQVMHMNDYPSNPPREMITDASRVFPGDGVCNLPELLGILHRTGGQKVLSVEVFNRTYWAQDPLEAAKSGLTKLKAVVERVKL